MSTSSYGPSSAEYTPAHSVQPTGEAWHNDESTPPEDLAAWEKCTQSRITTARLLRANIMKKTGPKSDGLGPLGAFKPEDILKAETKLTKRTVRLKNLVDSCVEDKQRLRFDLSDVGNALQELYRVTHDMSIAQNIIQERMELRSKRPGPEKVQDHLQKALESEEQVIASARASLDEKANAAKAQIASLKELQAEVHGAQLSKVHDDPSRESQISGLLDKLHQAKPESAAVCSKVTEAVRENEAKTQKASAKTLACIKKRAEETSELKQQIEKELKAMRSTIVEGEKQLHHLQLQIRFHSPAEEKDAQHQHKPDKAASNNENAAKKKDDAMKQPFKDLALAALNGGGLDRKKKQTSKIAANSPAMQEVRFKVKAACITCFGAVPLEAIFSQFDSDGSGELEEIELRLAMRRHLKIPQAVISDAMVAMLFEAIDSDDSGLIGLTEFVQFLVADVDVDELSQQAEEVKSTLEKLREAEGVLVADLQGKIKAARIDEACLKLTASRAKDPIDARSATAKPEDVQATFRRKTMAYCASKLDRRQPLKEETFEALRSKVQAAACICTVGPYPDVIFSRVDKERSGIFTDEDVKRAFRQILRIPVTSVADAEIFSLCGMLDERGLGTVSIRELVQFMDINSMQPSFAAIKPSRDNAAGDMSARSLPSPTPRLSKKVSSDQNSQMEMGVSYGVPLEVDQLQKMKAKICGAIQRCSHGRRLDLVLCRYSKARTGLLDYGEMMKVVRHGFKLTAKALPDAGIRSLCCTLDPQEAKHISVADFIAFLKCEDVANFEFDAPSRAHDVPHSAR